jgi:SAM-dependent methyltransferase
VSVLVLDAAQARLGFEPGAVVSRFEDAEATNFADETFDSILAIEAISHFPSLDRFLREANRILRAGGLLVAADGNNLSCPGYRRRRLRTWRRVRDEELAKRLRHLHERFPDIDPQLAASIALHTELMSFDEMDRLVPGICKEPAWQ